MHHSASSLGAILTQRVGRGHPLSGDRIGQLASDQRNQNRGRAPEDALHQGNRT